MFIKKLDNPNCFVSYKGDIFSFRYGRISKRVITKDKNGYGQVTLQNKAYKVHILVAMAFIGDRPEGMEIDHIDRNKLNNNIANLRYVSKSENCYNRRTSDGVKERLGTHWGSPGSETYKEANRAYRKIKYNELSSEDKRKRSIECTKRNKESLASKGLFRTRRLINGEWKNVILPLSEKLTKVRNKDGKITFTRSN